MKPTTFLDLLNSRKGKSRKRIVRRIEGRMSELHYSILSAAHKIDRIGKSKKYIEHWVTAVGLDPNEDDIEYKRMRDVIPKTSLKDAEREVSLDFMPLKIEMSSKRR